MNNYKFVNNQQLQEHIEYNRAKKDYLELKNIYSLSLIVLFFIFIPNCTFFSIHKFFFYGLFIRTILLFYNYKS